MTVGVLSAYLGVGPLTNVAILIDAAPDDDLTASERWEAPVSGEVDRIADRRLHAG
jgi:hypothetical protein